MTANYDPNVASNKLAKISRPSPSFRLRNDSLNTVRLRRVFDLFDEDIDGEVTAEEICRALDRLGLGPTDASALVDSVAEFVPPGKSGLDFDSFAALHRAIGESLLGPDAGAASMDEAEEMKEAFMVFDEDGDGFISAKELHSVLGKLGLVEGCSMDRVQKMIGGVDRDHDGRVDFAEFKIMMRSISIKS